MNSKSSIKFKITREEEAQLVTHYQWPFGAVERSDGSWEVSSQHRRHAWCRDNLRLFNPMPRSCPRDGQIIDPINNIPFVPPEFRMTVYYNGEKPRPEELFFDTRTRRYYVDNRRDNVEELRARYCTPEAIERHLAEEAAINDRLTKQMKVSDRSIPERIMGNACVLAQFDAEKIAGTNVNRKKLILEAFDDLKSVGRLKPGMSRSTAYRLIQLEIASHGVDCAVTTVRDVIYKYGR